MTTTCTWQKHIILTTVYKRVVMSETRRLMETCQSQRLDPVLPQSAPAKVDAGIIYLLQQPGVAWQMVLDSGGLGSQ